MGIPYGLLSPIGADYNLLQLGPIQMVANWVWNWTGSNMNSQKYIQEFKEYIIRPVYKFLPICIQNQDRVNIFYSGIEAVGLQISGESSI